MEFVDIYPTLCELAGINLPEHLEGASTVPLMLNPEKVGKEAAFTYWRNGGSLTTQDFSYTEYDNNERMLFDLRKDPGENENVSENPNYKEKIEELSKLLEEGWEKPQP